MLARSDRGCLQRRFAEGKASPENFSTMKTLALAGKGLVAFITTNLKDRFARKVR